MLPCRVEVCLLRDVLHLARERVQIVDDLPEQCGPRGRGIRHGLPTFIVFRCISNQFDIPCVLAQMAPSREHFHISVREFSIRKRRNFTSKQPRISWLDAQVWSHHSSLGGTVAVLVALFAASGAPCLLLPARRSFPGERICRTS